MPPLLDILFDAPPSIGSAALPAQSSKVSYASDDIEFETRQKIAAIQARYIIDGFTQNIKTIKEIAEIEAKNINPDLRFKPYSNTDVNVRNDNALIT